VRAREGAQLSALAHVDPPVLPETRPDAQAERFVGLTLLVGIVAAVVVFALLSWLATEMLAGGTRDFDTFVRNAVHGGASPGMTRFMIGVTRLGGPGVLVPIGVATALLFHRLEWKRAAVLLPITMLGAGLLDAGLKLGFQRLRPSAFFGYVAPTSYSFPSGHALFSFCFFAVLAALLSPRLERRVTRVAVWATAVVLIVAISVSRVYLGVHHPSDVVAGWGTGFVWVITAALGDRVTARLQRRRGRA